MNEFISYEVILGSLILIPGVILLSVDRAENENQNDLIENNGAKRFDDDKVKGLIYVMIAVFCYSLGMLFTTIGTVNIDPILANSIRVPIATIGLLFLMRASNKANLDKKSLETELKDDFNPFTWSNKFIILMLTSGFLVLTFLHYFWSYQYKRLEHQGVRYYFHGTIFSLPIAIYWLKEKLSYFTILGTIMTVVGLWVILI